MKRGTDCVVIDYRTPGDLAGFIESFVACRAPGDRLHVVLVDPTPQDAAVADTWATASWFGTLSTFSDNVGYGRACNAAAAGTELDVLAFFNADTRLSPGITAECRGALLARKDWGVLGPRQVDDNGLLTHVGIFGTNEAPHFRGAWHAPAGDRFQGVEDDAVSVSGSAYFMRRDVWRELADCPAYLSFLEETGAPTPWGAMLSTPLYFEDMWCSLHARSHGYKACYYGAATMLHLWHRAVEAAGKGEPTDKYQAAREMFRAACDAHEPKIARE